MSKPILVAGYHPMSLIDYPGKVAAVIFLAGCNLRCHYCHNPQLFDLRANYIPLRKVIKDLRRNRALLDAVVLTGGEPTCDPRLPSILLALRSLGLLIKLDTNGTRPAVVRSLVAAKLVDYVALDIKATPAKHLAITGAPMTPVLQTAKYLRAQNQIPYMFRTTLSPQLTAEDLVEIGQTIIDGAPVWQIQQCRVSGAYSAEIVQKMANAVKKYAQHVVVKGL